MRTVDNRRGKRDSRGYLPWLVFAVPLLPLAVGCGRGPSGLEPEEPMRPVVARGSLAEDEQTTVDIFRKVSPSVVHVTTLVTSETGPLGLDIEQIPAETGSGYIWDRQGHVVTNYHVLKGGDAVQVVLADHSTWDAKIVGVYPDEDIAVLFIAAPKEKLHPVMVGSSQGLQVGQNAYAIGNPFGLDHTMTKGILSALGREASSSTGHPMKGLIQTDAAINPGNSGGPLLDSAGRLIGMNYAILSPSGAFAGVGFALPVDEINRLATQLIEHGKIIRPRMGLQIAPSQWSEELGVQGVLVLHVTSGGPADKAGILPTRRTAGGRIVLGDVIVAIDNQPVKSSDDFFKIEDSHKIGDVVTVTVLRDGQKKDLKVTLGAA
jgi:S1-C subfamily serine protease